MKTMILLACLCCTLFSCENVEKKAGEKLQTAREAFERGDFSEAKMQIDSIKILYPKAFETRREGISLMQQVELKEQEKTLVYLDSLLQKKQSELDAIKGKFTLEKDAEYQKIGSFAETPASKDSYETTDLGEKIEKADYKIGEDGNVIGFLYLNKDKNIKVNYQGERPYSTTMTPADRQAVASIYELAQLLSSITEIKKEMEEANLKIEFVKRKMQEREEKETEQGK